MKWWGLVSDQAHVKLDLRGCSRDITVCSSFRLTHDISLEEYEDDDLSEVTEIGDEHGPSPTYCTLDLNVRGKMPLVGEKSPRRAMQI